jgi:hypothetical protein
MAEWRVVRSLLVLRDQIDALAPNRSKASDGTIGDAAHAASTSDHNPTFYPALGGVPVVCALDVTQDPAHGADMGPIAEALRVSRDRRIGYVIFNHRITGPNHGWAWDPYSGSDPHTNHMHVSTVHTALADDTALWQIGDDMAGEIADKALAQLDGGNALGEVYLRLLRGAGANGVPSGDGADEANLTVLGEKLDALTAAVSKLGGSATGGVSEELLEAAAERAVRKVLGGLDGATPTA